ncbi:uncharacterized protein LOC127788640 isoform X6 [Diospyros lotus]|uniref:uncharacterized protein LOC127788640 isoform X6 n=1 Tax=Diospyros lotus TaxID=55363 RepID=UPI0022553583|nr:uncharacterized protein LOC127788640 isoform X6 [Diospyros lotus]
MVPRSRTPCLVRMDQFRPMGPGRSIATMLATISSRRWMRSDQLLLGCLFSTIDKEVIGQVIHCESAAEFWNELSPQSRQELLTIDKQTLFEQARKNMYCSRCNGLLLEGFLQIVMYGKSLQQEGSDGHLSCNRKGAFKIQNNPDLDVSMACKDEVQDPYAHPWGGLTTTRDGALTLLDCYLYSKSLKGLQVVFDSAYAREHDREWLYPDACGGGGLGGISHGGHGTRETCALHTARLSVDTLVDFWSALGEETRLSLLRMKEEDFIERLMYRFDSKRFCRDCRRNVIREFKELKELKRMRREPHCTSWFCVADTAFQYEFFNCQVSHDTVQADWHQTFVDNVGMYHHFEWAIGTGEGKSDILEFENVGMSGRVQASGLDLGGLNACYITLRAWKIDGRCSELSVKAHALKGQQCVHGRLIVGDGFVTITRGQSIRRFFEHAEETEEEEDDDSMDKDGNELDGECSRPQKHAKSPELAREFLLDAATVIFKEQVEKAFREGTARQNAHSIFVCLALKLLEERVHVACKEIITLEKQMKLLEEEEKEKREEEERKERRRMKEREKKLRRKERLRGKEKDREKKSSELNPSPVVPDVLEEVSLTVDEHPNTVKNGDSICEAGDSPHSPLSLDAQDEQPCDESVPSNMENHSDDISDEKFPDAKDVNSSFGIDHSKVSHRKLKFLKDFQLDQTLKCSDGQRFTVLPESRGGFGKAGPRHRGDNFDTFSKSINGLNKQMRSNSTKPNTRNSVSKFGERFHCLNNRMGSRSDSSHACSCSQHNDYRAKLETHPAMTRVGRETKAVNKSESVSDISKSYLRCNKYSLGEYVNGNFGRPKSKVITGHHVLTRDLHNTKKVWEPMESQRKYPRSSSDTDFTLQSSTFKVEDNEPNNLKSSGTLCSDEVAEQFDENSHTENHLKEPRGSIPEMGRNCQNFQGEQNPSHFSTEAVEPCPVTTSPLSETIHPSMSVTSNSDNCSSCLSEGDSNMSSSNSPNPESLSSSDSEDVSQQSEGRDNSASSQNKFPECHEAGMRRKQIAEEREAFGNRTSSEYIPIGAKSDHPISLPTKTAAENIEDGRINVNVGSQYQGTLPPVHNQSIPFPMFQATSAMGYYQQSPVSWPAAPANGLIPFPHPNHYVFASSPYGYGLNGNSHFMQYGPLQHLTPPLLNPGQVPVYRPVKANGMNSKDQTGIPKPCGVHEAFGEPNVERAAPAGQHRINSLPSGDCRTNGNPDTSHKGKSGFSLFHFGGPVALSTEHLSDPVPSKDGGDVGDLSSNSLADNFEDDEGAQACNKKDTIEEYNLFAASNGIRFSFFSDM